MNEIPRLVTNKPDTELAAEHKANVVEASKPLMEALSKASKDGFVAQLAFGPDAFGRITITQFLLMKQF